ncbi:hypothetical protein [Sphingomonas mollis]|uniref:Virulence factor n=1 Tax=Sphingomonas mollis TaxID=2795726 RepID=A0ABS0XRR4_9SPHN|nr:hypothetical protein [Sphingomonas sp. BT553]MBJ6122723.1 hypothetical protein [Sphingomonas sp. BT553]
MSVTPIYPQRGQGDRPSRKAGRVYAIAYDLNTEAAERHGAWHKIARVFESYGFTRQQGSVFYGNEKTSAMTCAAAVLEVNDRYTWFWEVVRDMRVLRIDEEDDLLQIVPNRLRFDTRDVA